MSKTWMQRKMENGLFNGTSLTDSARTNETLATWPSFFLVRLSHSPRGKSSKNATNHLAPFSRVYTS